jgi:hypothetical protein
MTPVYSYSNNCDSMCLFLCTFKNKTIKQQLTTKQLYAWFIQRGPEKKRILQREKKSRLA